MTLGRAKAKWPQVIGAGANGAMSTVRNRSYAISPSRISNIWEARVVIKRKSWPEKAIPDFQNGDRAAGAFCKSFGEAPPGRELLLCRAASFWQCHSRASIILLRRADHRKEVFDPFLVFFAATQ